MHVLNESQRTKYKHKQYCYYLSAYDNHNKVQVTELTYKYTLFSY